MLYHGKAVCLVNRHHNLQITTCSTRGLNPRYQIHPVPATGDFFEKLQVRVPFSIYLYEKKNINLANFSIRFIQRNYFFMCSLLRCPCSWGVWGEFLPVTWQVTSQGEVFMHSARFQTQSCQVSRSCGLLTMASNGRPSQDNGPPHACERHPSLNVTSGGRGQTM